MIVDDEPFNHDSLKMIFSKICKPQFMHAFNGQQAVQLVKEAIANQDSSITVILMDIDMPVLNGLEVPL
jgi:CheY-like chemotaxis protein